MGITNHLYTCAVNTLRFHIPQYNLYFTFGTPPSCVIRILQYRLAGTMLPFVGGGPRHELPDLKVHNQLINDGNNERDEVKQVNFCWLKIQFLHQVYFTP